MTEKSDRYHFQELLPFWGETGRAKLAQARVLIIGCGGLGGYLGQLLARAGVGSLRLIDNDAPTLTNLHRQILFDERDVLDGNAKTAVAERLLRRANSTIEVDAHPIRLGPDNIEPLLDDIDLALDATDNFSTRYLLNEACCRRGIPWIYGGVVGTVGAVLRIVPGDGPCLRCIYPEPPDEEKSPTSGRDGILNSLPPFVAAVQATEAYRHLLGLAPAPGRMLHLNLWDQSFQAIELKRNPACLDCGAGK